MKLFYDLRLGYLVSAPGQESPVSDLAGKAGDGDELIIQFGRSSDPTGSAAIVASQTWTPENLPGGTVITAGLKELGEYSDGVLLTSNSTWTHSSGAFTYTGAISYNTTAINTALSRADANPENNLGSLNCSFEITFQPGGSGPWRSSLLPVGLVLHHDILGGSEGTPTAADDPTEYLLKTAGIEWLPTITSQVGGTSADLDGIPTPSRTINTLVAFYDTDAAANIVRIYRLQAGTDAESAPDVIRPDDYATTTNERVWVQTTISADMILPDVVSQVDAEAGTSTASRTWTAERVKQAIKALEDPTVAEPPNGLTSSVANEVVLFNGTDGKQLKRATTTGIAKLTSGVLSAGVAATDYVAPGATNTSGLTMATSRLLGRTTASAGAIEEITVGSGLTLAGGSLAVASDGLPNGIVDVTTDTNLTVGAHNGKLIQAGSSATTVTILKQSSSTWTDNSHFWVANRRASGTVTITPDSTVALTMAGTASGNVVIEEGGKPVHIWRSAENVWRVIS
jgi:hypothetical protein